MKKKVKSVELIASHKLVTPENLQILYAVIALRDPETAPKYDTERCFAICTTLERAKEMIETNETDIHETVYRYALVEAKVADVMYAGFAEEQQQWWYEWSKEEQQYLPLTNPPERFTFTVGFGIG